MNSFLPRQTILPCYRVQDVNPRSCTDNTPVRVYAQNDSDVRTWDWCTDTVSSCGITSCSFFGVIYFHLKKLSVGRAPRLYKRRSKEVGHGPHQWSYTSHSTKHVTILNKTFRCRIQSFIEFFNFIAGQ